MFGMQKNIPPRYTASEVQRLVQQHYGLQVRQVEPLDSYDDQNFFVVCDDGRKWVAKIANAREHPIHLEAQNAVLEFLSNHALGLPCSRLLRAPCGKGMIRLKTDSGHVHFMRLVSHIAGQFLADVSDQSPGPASQTLVTAKHEGI